MKNKPSRTTFRNRLGDMVTYLRNKIMQGEYAPGEYLPSESILADQFELSNKSVRKGIDVLVQEGLVIKIQRVGSQVTEAARQNRTTLTLTCSSGSIYRDFALQHLLDDFHKLYPTIQVRTVLKEFNSFESIKEYIQNSQFDVTTITHQDFCSLQEDDGIHLLEPLDITQEIYPFLTKRFVVKDQLYAQPIIFSPLVLCYNKDHFKEASLSEPDASWTWNDVIECAERLSRKKDRHGLYFHVLSDNRWPLFLLQSNMKFEVNNENKYSLNGTKLMDSIRLYKDIIHNHNIFPQYFSESNDDAAQLFIMGKVSMILTTYTSLNELRRTGIPYDISPPPFIDRPISLAVSIAAAVNAAAPNKEAAKLLLHYLSSARAQRIIRRETLSLPATKSVAEEESEGEIYFPDRFPLFRETLSTLRFHQDLNLSRFQFTTLKHYLKMYWSKMINEQELSTYLETMKPVMARMKK